MRPPRRPWAPLALAGGCGVLLGILVAVGLGAGSGATITTTQRVTVTAAASTPPPGATVITKTLAPELVGQRLDEAKQRTGRARFDLVVDHGGGLFGVLRDHNWLITAQRPAAGTLLEQGSSVHVDIAKP